MNVNVDTARVRTLAWVILDLESPVTPGEVVAACEDRLPDASAEEMNRAVMLLIDLGLYTVARRRRQVH